MELNSLLLLALIEFSGVISPLLIKGQLISKCPFGVIVWTNFCPTHSRAEFVKFFGGVLVQTMKAKGHFEINWPLSNSSVEASLRHRLTKLINKGLWLQFCRLIEWMSFEKIGRFFHIGLKAIGTGILRDLLSIH